MPPTSKRGYLYLGDDDDEEIKVIPIKKRSEDCCDKEQLKTIKIVQDCSSDSVRARFQSNFPQTPVDMIYPQTFAIWNSS